MTLAIQTRALEFSFGRTPVLRRLDLDVPTGTVFGFLGRNAAGKTTTLRLIMGMLKAQRGVIEIGGKAYRQVPHEVRATLGYVSQEQHFYEWMRVRALGHFVGSFYKTWDTTEFERLLGAMGIERDQPVSELSGGTKMKLAIALALAHRPALLILDEPTAGVDPVVRREILLLLKEQASEHGRTVFFSTHHISEVQEIGGAVGIIHEGRIVFQGTLDEAQRQYRRISGPAPIGAQLLDVDTDGRQVVRASSEAWANALDPGERLELDDIFFYATRRTS